MSHRRSSSAARKAACPRHAGRPCLCPAPRRRRQTLARRQARAGQWAAKADVAAAIRRCSFFCAIGWRLLERMFGALLARRARRGSVDRPAAPRAPVVAASRRPRTGTCAERRQAPSDIKWGASRRPARGVFSRSARRLGFPVALPLRCLSAVWNLQITSSSSRQVAGQARKPALGRGRRSTPGSGTVRSEQMHPFGSRAVPASHARHRRAPA